MKVPKLYSVVKIKFSSLRNGIGCNMGVVFDNDELVERSAMRVRTADDWRWQIKGLKKLTKNDSCAETDQAVLNEIGTDLDLIELVSPLPNPTEK